MARRSSAAVAGEATGSGRAVAQSLPFVCDLEKLLTGRRTLYNLIGRHACADHGYARPIYSLRQFGVIDYGVGIEPPNWRPGVMRSSEKCTMIKAASAERGLGGDASC
jgi:hypothetical protein